MPSQNDVILNFEFKDMFSDSIFVQCNFEDIGFKNHNKVEKVHTAA